jgi:DNA-binding transcriptional regulator YiaG
MPSVNEVLKTEVSRLSRKVVRQFIKPVHSATSAHRKQLAALKRQVQQLERRVAALGRSTIRSVKAAEPEDASGFRFSAKGLKSLRARLDLSAEDFGRLIDVSGQTVYSWESQKTKPRARQLPAIAGLRKLGKREALAKLEALAAK